MISLDQFKSMIPKNREADKWYEIAVDMFEKYDITTTNRIAGFMAQCSHESRDFTALEENLNYSEKALNSVFSRYFGQGKRNAAEYARKPEKIANYVYQDKFRSKGGAMGNTQEGDGWRFRGRGIKQLTGRNNYTAFAKTVGMTAEEAADYLGTKKGAFESACWFWKTNNIAHYADNDDIVGMTKRINGGTIGLKDREARYNRAKQILSVSSGPVNQPVKTRPEPTKPVQVSEQVDTNNSNIVLKRGSRGPEVAKMQKALGIDADGVFGIGTAAVLKNWQRANGLTADGIAGPSTLSKLYK